MLLLRHASCAWQVRPVLTGARAASILTRPCRLSPGQPRLGSPSPPASCFPRLCQEFASLPAAGGAGGAGAESVGAPALPARVRMPADSRAMAGLPPARFEELEDELGTGYNY